MPSGGARPNSGRKPGGNSLTHSETQKIIAKAADDGVLPLQVMLDNIRFYRQEAAELVAKLMAGDAPVNDDGERSGIIDVISQVVNLRKLAGEEAARAAPYCHPRQGNAPEGTGDSETVPLSERLAAYQRRDDIAQSAGKVVEFPPK